LVSVSPLAKMETALGLVFLSALVAAVAVSILAFELAVAALAEDSTALLSIQLAAAK